MVTSILMSTVNVKKVIYTHTYSDLLHEDSIGGLSFVQQAVHVLHAARGCVQLFR